MPGGAWFPIGILIIIKLVIIAVIVIRYKVSKHFNKPVFLFKSFLALSGLLVAILFFIWPDGFTSMVRGLFDYLLG
jgi:hypothetical protein